MSGKVQVVVGGQFGSEGKGAICGWLADQERHLMAMRVAGPNAGHTVIGKIPEVEGRTFKFRHLPVASVRNKGAKLMLGAGSEVDIEVLREELGWTDVLGTGGRLLVDQEATYMDASYASQEEGIRSGTTGKGIGAARAARAMRQAELVSGMGTHEFRLADTAAQVREGLKWGETLQIEGTQGYGLGLHAGYYPHCTSSDCRAVDFLAMAGVSPWAPEVSHLEIWVVLRTFPIRIAGNSGPMFGETTWEELRTRTSGYIEPEYTTVTKKIRRVGEWDDELALNAISANGGWGGHVKLALTFLDYLHPEVAGQTRIEKGSSAWTTINWFEEQLGMPISLVGTGPDAVVDLRERR